MRPVLMQPVPMYCSHAFVSALSLSSTSPCASSGFTTGASGTSTL